MRDQEKRTIRQERRPQIYSATDILGEGFGPTATQLLDWNDDVAILNGYFWSPVGSINSPDADSEWAGIVIAEDESVFGVQIIWSVRESDPPREYRRRFSSPSGSTRTYTPWRGDLDWQYDGCTPLNGATIAWQQHKVSYPLVSISARISLGATIAVDPDGGVINTGLLQLPVSLIPASVNPQYLGGSSLGPGTWWLVDNTGVIQMTATVPGAVLDAGTDVAVMGIFML